MQNDITLLIVSMSLRNDYTWDMFFPQEHGIEFGLSRRVRNQTERTILSEVIAISPPEQTLGRRPEICNGPLRI